MMGSTADLSSGSPMKRTASIMLAFVIGGALALFGFRTFVLQPFTAPSLSMHPAITEGDYFLVSKVTYHFRAPRRGEIVVFNMGDSGVKYVKRIVGLPGDHVQMKGGVLRINGTACPRVPESVDVALMPANGGTFSRETLPGGGSYAVLEMTDDGLADNTQEYVVPEGHYFMLGDNRDNSQDSRFLDAVGYIPREALVGPVALRLWNSRGQTMNRPVEQAPSAVPFSNP